MKQLPMPESLEPFCKDITLWEGDDPDSDNSFPFYADGFHGIIYSRSTNPFYLQPRNKALSDFYLYGQTIEPISLDVRGAFQFTCIRMYPFAVRILLGVDPKILNDDCFDLIKIEGVDTAGTLERLRHTHDHEEQVSILAAYFVDLLNNASVNPDYRIKLAINLILNSKGTMSVKELRDRLSVAERTLERHFLKEIGVTAKQFAKIIQFSSSMQRMTESDYLSLTEISQENGFADQSHFIRTFKRFTGKSPREFRKSLVL